MSDKNVDSAPVGNGSGPPGSSGAPPVAGEFKVAPGWLVDGQCAVNADCNRRVVMLPDDQRWIRTAEGPLQICILEYLPEHDGRLTLLCHLAAKSPPAQLNFCGNTELYVQHGTLDCDAQRWTSGLYVRRPDCTDRGVTLRVAPPKPGSPLNAAPGALLYASTGQLADTDTEERSIDTNEADRWLGGPVEGTEVMPLHGHGTSNAMLVRWLQPAAFQPRLDPMGEEVLVLSGMLHDAHGDYPAGTWIRNPIPAWQSWGAQPGTVVLYKSGHFYSAEDSTTASMASPATVTPSGTPMGSPMGSPKIAPTSAPTGVPKDAPTDDLTGDPPGGPKGDPTGDPTGDPANHSPGH